MKADAADRIKSIREAKEVSGIDIKQGAEMCGLQKQEDRPMGAFDGGAVSV